uniref:Uncharacterized protein n=1 Tax=Anguilla anguilla TaxID=7936 RepID=A0A0E9P865_ANGAN
MMIYEQQIYRVYTYKEFLCESNIELFLIIGILWY